MVGEIILRSIIHDFHVPFLNLAKKFRKNFSKSFFVTSFSFFHSSLLYIMGELARGGSVDVVVGLVTGDCSFLNDNFTGCHSFFMCLVRNLQEKWKKMSRINPVVALH